MDIHDYHNLVGSVSSEFRESGLDFNEYFVWAIRKQNTMYGLPVNESPTLHNLNESPVSRMAGFMKTLEKEMTEGAEIQAVLKLYTEIKNGNLPEDIARTPILEFFKNEGIVDDPRNVALASGTYNSLMLGGMEELEKQILVMLADWFADMQVYIRSEALKYGIPHESILNVVMGSNFTKLGSDGLPIKDENGKFLKGPNFIPPEKHIYATMFEAEELMQQSEDFVQYTNDVLDVSYRNVREASGLENEEELYSGLEDECEYPDDHDDEDEMEDDEDEESEDAEC